LFYQLGILGSAPLIDQEPLRLISRTQYLNSQAIVVEVSETVGLALQDFHFGVEAFGDAVVAGEAPHGGDLVLPGMKGVAQLNQLRQAAVF
jgi:hypothetical protein